MRHIFPSMQDILSHNTNCHAIREDCVLDCYQGNQRQCGPAVQVNQ